MQPTPPPVALCDFDNKPTPRKRVKKPKDVEDTVVKSSADIAEEQQEDEEDSEGYETATEELTDRHQLEQSPYATSTTASTNGANKTYASQSAVNHNPEKEEDVGDESRATPQKRVSRRNFSSPNNTDPGYPELPKMSQEEDAESMSTGSARNKVAVHPEKQENVSHQRQNDTDDEYADPELEDALGRMSLDDSGTLTEDVNDSASDDVNSLLTANHNDLEVQSAQHIEPAINEDASLDADEPDEPTPTLQSDIGLLDEPSRTPEYNLATTWAQEHLRFTIPSPTSTVPSRIRATVTHLRAYHMWYYQKLPVHKMAQILRDPPLSHNTVANYILQAVTLERLEYDQESLRNILLAMPVGMRKGRWRVLAEEVDVLK
jgi:hypothetical protein